ncbi:cardiolipin synthase [Luteimonas sp. 3794]|uniref:cardiolipin synthase n=1 Tax=Luteimonas sp. 3794 TaxID=2817730 RepID=UPI0028590F7C|nr:cardiolipin synthase [Luteimonas sp. 3794]MDR6992221.1 cardiolipin synthase [Luteimonas sp. 3794]
MSNDDLHIGLWILVADWLIRIAALLWIPARTRSSAARSWLLLIGFVPLLGLPAYLLLGHPWLSKLRRERQAQASRLIRQRQMPLTALRWCPADTFSAQADAARLVERLGDFMPTNGNAVELLDDYAGSLQRLVDDIDAATREVNLLYYLMRDDATGRKVADALERAARRGVRCRLLLDAVGAKPGLRAFRRTLRDAGVSVQATLAGGFAWRRSARMDLRNHRKIAVIDGRLALTGSQNLADPEFVPGHPNREVVARVRGPVVAQLQALFASDWYIETGEVLEVDAPPIAPSGHVAAQLLPSGPAYPFENARDVLIALVQRARRRAVLVTPYFVPDEATLGALRVAALSGVSVQLILSATNNQRLTAWAQAGFYDELLAAGVRIALYRPHFLHAKHLSIDDDIALVGSSNLDIRSFMLNAEAGLLCFDAGVVARLREIELDYLRESDVLDTEDWTRRPAWRRSVEGIARLADSFL